MPTVARLLQSKGNDIYSVTPDSSVYDAIAVMADRNIGAVLVMEGDRLAGIMSERDYARKVILKGKASRETPVRDIVPLVVFDTVLGLPPMPWRDRFRQVYSARRAGVADAFDARRGSRTGAPPTRPVRGCALTQWT